MIKQIAALVGLILLSSTAAHADIDADAEMFGALPKFSDVVISPNGEIVALLQSDGTDGAVYVKNIVTGENIMARAAPKVFRLDARFVDDRYLLVDRHYYRARRDGLEVQIVPYMETLIYDLKKQDTYGFLEKNRTVAIHPYTPRRIVGPSPREGHVYATSFGSGGSGGYTFNLYEVKLSNGRGKLAMRGDYDLRPDFLPSPNGQSVLRENHALEKRVYALDLFEGEIVHHLFDTDSFGIESLLPSGFDASGETLYYRLDMGRNLSHVLMAAPSRGPLDMTDPGAPAFGRNDADVEEVLTDFQNIVYGVRFSGFKPSYDFVDDRIDIALEEIQSLFPDDSIKVSSWSNDFYKIVVLISGASQAGNFYVYDVADKKLTSLARQYPDIPDERIGRIETIRYAARDGLEIPALLTHPVGAPVDAGPAPLIVMPHGGPESYDQVRYDFWAQFLANQGYLILQPNFRGSEGFGRRFRDAGRGEWGRKMQDDITDGVKHLIKTGQADADNVCIVGASYGGYAALAGGAFTPDLYKCVVSFAGVADLEGMLRYEREKGGRSNNFSLAYWETVIGSNRRQRDELFAASPARNAAGFKAPVLLVHGDFDWIVPADQSAVMEQALKDAGKDVTIFTLKAGDHTLSQSVHRTDLLKLTGEFLAEHLSPGAAAPSPAEAAGD